MRVGNTWRMFGFFGRGIVTKVFLGWHSGRPRHTISLSSWVHVSLDTICLDWTLLRRLGWVTSKAYVVRPISAMLTNIAWLVRLGTG